MPSTDSTVARRIFGARQKPNMADMPLVSRLNTAELDRLRNQKFESGSLQWRVACELPLPPMRQLWRPEVD